jgi:3-oxoadipate enol-lactonase
MPTQSSLLELENARIYAEDGGAGEPLLLLHGLALDHRSWDEQVGPLRERYRAVRIDLHGFGRSSQVGGPYSHAAILRQVLTRLGIERAHVVGHSMGGRIAAEFVQTHPAAARSLTLVSADIGGLPFKTLGPAFGRIFEAGRRGDIAGAKQLFLELESFGSLRERPDLMAHVSSMVAAYSGWLFANSRENPELRPPRATAETLGDFRLPTLVVSGALDAADFRDIADEIAARVPGAHKTVVAGTGHLPQLEAPEVFNRALLEFLS